VSDVWGLPVLLWIQSDSFPLRNSHFWTERGKMGHYVKESLWNRKKLQTDLSRWGQLELQGDQKVSFELCLACAQGVQWKVIRGTWDTNDSFCSLKGNVS
jgi:hypothetical protein